MEADEAAEAVQLPSSAQQMDSERPTIQYDAGEDDPGNPHKLRKCSILLKRVGYIEEAVERGCKSVRFTVSSKSRQAWPKIIL